MDEGVAMETRMLVVDLRPCGGGAHRVQVRTPGLSSQRHCGRELLQPGSDAKYANFQVLFESWDVFLLRPCDQVCIRW